MHETGLDALRDKTQKAAVIKRLGEILPQNARQRQSRLSSGSSNAAPVAAAAEYRTRSAQLPRGIAEKIAFGNAERLFRP